MTTQDWTYADMITTLHAKRRFAFVRYSDGDWNCIFGRTGGIGDEHKYKPDLGKALLDSLKPEADYHVGLMPSLLTPGRWWASERVIRWRNANPDLTLCSSLLLHSAGMRGKLDNYFEALRGNRLVVVGNAGAVAMRPWLGDFEHVVIPVSDCWDSRHEILPRILSACKAPGVAMFSCSMPAKVWIRQAWDAGCAASLVDIGAVFDPYLGKLSRSYMADGGVKLAKQLYPEASSCTSK